MANIWAIMIIVITVILLWELNLFVHKEGIVKIGHYAGTANNSDSAPAIADGIDSAPIMDYMHTYWDGKKLQPLDNGPDVKLCTQHMGEHLTDPMHDLDPEFMKSRERIGAAQDTRKVGARPCDGFQTCDMDGDKSMTLGRCYCKTPDSKTIQLLYDEVMELDIQRDQEMDDCEYVNHSYLFKEPCFDKT